MKPNQILNLAVLCFLVMLTPKFLTAQTVKGSWFAEGNLGNIGLSSEKHEFTSTSGNKSKSEGQRFNFSLYPRIGYLINDNFAIGVSLNYLYQSIKNQSYSESGTKASDFETYRSNIGLSPFLRYYFTKNSKNRFYGQLGGGISIDILNKGEVKSYDDTGDIYSSGEFHFDQQVIFGEVLIGFNHFFNDNVAFNSALGYNYSKRTVTLIDDESSEPNEQKNVNVVGDIVWNFGFTFMITGNKAN